MVVLLISDICYLRSQAHIAQSVEHFLGKEEVTGSSPVMGSIVFVLRRQSSE